MKFIDELDIERINQTLNFETTDCKIIGSCDIYTTKPVTSDKKLYKAIDSHLESILQENESYNNVLQHLKAESNMASPLFSPIAVNSSPYQEPSNNVNDTSRRSSMSFWEQKRRMSVSNDINNNNINNSNINDTSTLLDININSINKNINSTINTINSDIGNKNNDNNTLNNNSDNNKIYNRSSRTSFTLNSKDSKDNTTKTSKLNDQNLKDIMSNTDGYISSSSIDSNQTNSKRKFSLTKFRRSSSATNISNTNNINNSSNFSSTNVINSDTARENQKNSNSSFKYRRSSLNDSVNKSINIGPFGPINEPSSRRTFAYLIAILNASYPDHDFSSVEPTDFCKSSFRSFLSKFESSLYSLGKKPEEWIWEVINSHMSIKDCIIYQYTPPKSFLEDEPGYLWSLMGFLFNKKRKRVAFIYLICSRLNNNGFNRYPLITSKQNLIISDDMDQYEGEYDLAIDENAIDDDSDDDLI